MWKLEIGQSTKLPNRGIMGGKTFTVHKKVYLADTDLTGIAYYARHLEWLEMARIDFIAAIYKPLTRLISEDKISFMPINVNIERLPPFLRIF